MPISNSYQAYNTDGTTDPAGSFAYWTDPVFDTATTPNPGHDTNPSMVYAPVPPATAHPAPSPNTITPAPWVPFTRAGCNVGDVATANQELENTGVDIPKVFGANSPEAQQLAADPYSFKDPETADYVGIAVHCAQDNAFCATAKAVEVRPDHPVADRRVRPAAGRAGRVQRVPGPVRAQVRRPAARRGGTPNLKHNGFQVTNAAGNLVDLNGNQINGGFLSTPGFPGFGPINAAQTLAYVADMLESGVPVVNGYIADIHGNEGIPSLSKVCPTGKNGISALGSGSACYIAQAQYYNAAFGTFFKRLAADGINASNTEFILSSDEGDHEAGANVGRAIQPTPANCDGVTVPCTYPAGSFGELGGNITGLLVQQKNDNTPFSLENDTAPEFYVTGNPDPNTSAVRKLEHDVAGLTANNPYVGGTQNITNYIADPAEEAILHMVNADPARTPTFAMFAKPDYFLQDLGPTSSAAAASPRTPGSPTTTVTTPPRSTPTTSAWPAPASSTSAWTAPRRPSARTPPGPNSGQEVVANSGTTGTWVDETDIRPTLMYLTGLTDDYIQDGRVITEVLTDPNHALSRPGVAALGACYKQLNSSVGQFGNFTLQASTAAVESSTPGDAEYLAVNAALTGLDQLRDSVAIPIKDALNAAAVSDKTINGTNRMTRECQAVVNLAGALAQHL